MRRQRAGRGRLLRDVVGGLAVFFVAYSQFALVRHHLRADDSSHAAPPGRLLIPVEGVAPHRLIDSFHHPRGSNRVHQAIDIAAPRNTPVLAAQDGVIRSLQRGGTAGLAVFQFDPQQRHIYFYAHLEEFAAGLEEGDPVEQGQVIGYVGTSGNAPANVPHLHFAIHELGPTRSFRQGLPINPYPLLAP